MHQPAAPHGSANGAVWQEVENVLRHPQSIAAEYERRLVAAQRSDASSDLAAAELQLAKLRRGMDRLIDGYAEGLIERQEFEPRLAGFRQRIQGWEAQANAMRDDAAQRRTLSLVIGRLEEFSDRVQNSLATADWQQRRELIRLLVKRVEIGPEDVNVVFRVEPVHSPPDPDRSGAVSANLQDCTRRTLAEAEELARRQAVGAAPLQAALAVDPFEVADQQHAEVAPRRQRGSAPTRGVVGRALSLDEAAEPGADEFRLQPVVEHVARRARHLH